MPIAEKSLVPVLDTVLDFAQSALENHAADQARIAELQSKVAQHDRVILEKVAAVKANALDPEQVDQVLNNMVGMHLLSREEGVKVASKLKRDPQSSLDLITKMAEMLVTPSEGREHDSGSVESEDPDGWTAFAEGHRVRLNP